MSKLSVIIPSRNERFLYETVQDILKNSVGEIEVIAVLDEVLPERLPPDDDRVILLHRGKLQGMRKSINSAVDVSTGEWLLKCDAHCMFSEGFDEVLKKDCADNWLQVLRRYSLDAELWERRPKAPIDYHYLDCPMTNQEYFQFHGVVWGSKAREREDILVDDLMSFQGSMWFMARKYWDRLGPMDEYGYGTFSQEPQELGNKVWLGGGEIKVRKDAWYAHLHKGRQWGRMYHLNMDEVKRGHLYSAWYWMSNQWKDRVHNIEWLIEKFWPLPNWPDNWMQLLDDWRKTAVQPEGNY